MIVSGTALTPIISAAGQVSSCSDQAITGVRARQSAPRTREER